MERDTPYTSTLLTVERVTHPARQHCGSNSRDAITSKDENDSIKPTTPRMPEIAGRPATEKTSGTKGTPAIAAMTARTGMQAMTLTHAAAVTLATARMILI